jgi:outer membrane protein
MNKMSVPHRGRIRCPGPVAASLNHCLSSRAGNAACHCAFRLLALLSILGSLSIAYGSQAEEPSGSPSQGALTLSEVVRMVLGRAPEISLAEAEAARAQAAVREARSLNLPQAVIGTGLAYNNGFPLSIEGAAPSIFLAGISQSIFSRKNRSLILEAEANEMASRTGTDASRNDLAFRAAILYSELYRVRQLLTLWSTRLEGTIKELQVAETLLEAGRIRHLEVTTARASVGAAQHQVLACEERARLLEVELRELTGLPQETPIRTAEPKIEDETFSLSLEAMCQRALENNPAVRQAEATLRAREMRVEAEKGGKYPRLEIVGQYALFSQANNYQDYFNRFTRNNFILGLSVQLPVFDGFQTDARVAQSRQEAAATRLRLQCMKSELRLSIQRAASALHLARSAADLAAREEEAAQEARGVDENLYELGRITWSEIEVTRNKLREKEIGRIDAERLLFQRNVELLGAIGNLVDCF